jgi:hypothetical protein
MNDEDKKPGGRGPDRRSSSDRRQTQVDPTDLPFPDRRKGDRRQMDRRILSDEEREALKKVIVPDPNSETDPS